MGQQMKILVTGGLGLIGHNVVQRLESQQHKVIITDTRTNYGIVPQAELDYLMSERLKKISSNNIYHIDITDADNFDWLVNKHKPEVIIHLASFPRQKVVNANPAWGSRVMSEGLINVCESAKKHHVQRVVYISSSMVYGDFDDQVTEDYQCRPIGQYGILKLTGEDIVKDYNRQGAFDCTIIRPSAVYGPLDVEDRVVSKFMLTAMRGGVLNVNGAGETLDFTYVDDTADGIVAAALSPQSANKTYNITRSASVSLLTAAELIVGIAGQGSIQCKDRDSNFPSRGALNIHAARTDFGYDPKVDVEQGFQYYYDWIKHSEYYKCQLQNN
jgi:nucleoside-diphosphate-sugar epimerase